jgi:hypothetical protein
MQRQLLYESEVFGHSLQSVGLKLANPNLLPAPTYI